MPLCLKEKLRHCTIAEISNEIFRRLKSKFDISSHIKILEWNDHFRGVRAHDLRSEAYRDKIQSKYRQYTQLGRRIDENETDIIPEIEEFIIKDARISEKSEKESKSAPN
jgi:hypothetical protein